ncbi:MAG: hypothetical protein ABH823_03790 [bacterium]
MTSRIGQVRPPGTAARFEAQSPAERASVCRLHSSVEINVTSGMGLSEIVGVLSKQVELLVQFVDGGCEFEKGKLLLDAPEKADLEVDAAALDDLKTAVEGLAEWGDDLAKVDSDQIHFLDDCVTAFDDLKEEARGTEEAIEAFQSLFLEPIQATLDALVSLVEAQLEALPDRESTD